MTRVHILTPGFTSPNGCAFLFPLIHFGEALAELGIRLRLFADDGDLTRLADCDVVILDSKFYSSRWVHESDAVLERIARLGEVAAKLLYFDITDSSGWDHARALPFVTGYFKNQLLKDRGLYLRPLYGHRLYTDYYHRSAGVVDDDKASSAPIADAVLLSKLQVGWNSGLADYSLHGPLRMALYRRLPLSGLLRMPRRFVASDRSRPRELSCRIGTGYARRTVAHQREMLRQRLAKRLSTDKLGRRRYLRELECSRIVVSPFGLGEITLRDFEIFLAGALALKPDMAHMETWPDLFRSGETIATHRWDLSDLEEVIDGLLADDRRRIEIARQGQEAYRMHLVGEGAAQRFAERVQRILAFGDKGVSQAAQ